MQDDQELGRELFGYKKDDVDRFLAKLHLDLRIAKDEIERLKTELGATEEILSDFRELVDEAAVPEDDFGKRAAEIVDKATDETASIIARASDEAREPIEAAGAERDAFLNEHEELVISKQELHSKVKSILDHYTSLFAEAQCADESGAKRRTYGPTAAPEPRLERKRPLATDLSTEKLLLERLTRLGDIQGVSTVWLFTVTGNVVSSFNRLRIDLPDVTSALVSLEKSAEDLEIGLQDGHVRMLFLQLDKLVVILNPVTESVMLGIIASAGSPIGQIFWYLDKEIPEFRKLLS
ncbi:MAG: DivIVA domain-containing protein [Actinobacteria bacterium]|nr:DivIVA domain-containing protein [Actinomycetota bacterium]